MLMNETKKDLLNELAISVIEYDDKKAKETARKSLELGIDPIRALEEGLGRGIREMGEKFDRMEICLPELEMAAETIRVASEILTAELSEEETEQLSKGKIVIGTVKGDIHDIGKNLVATMLSANGFTVVDLGVDLSIPEFISRAKSEDADIIALSSLMTTSIDEQKDLIQELTRQGIRDKFKVIVGGGPVQKEWADEIGADGYGKDMKMAVIDAKKIMEK